MGDRAHQSGEASYRAAGVDIDSADAVKDRIAHRATQTHGPEVLRGVGLFGGFFRAPGGEQNRQVLVASADSVGTKVLLASLLGRHRGIGVDLVNHGVNDLLACGALPLFFLDYYAAPSLKPEVLVEIVDGIADALMAAGCALIGGETAQLPGIYQAGTYDLAGFIVGSVDESAIVDGSAIRAGDLVVGLASSGLHTNGYSLARVALGVSPQTPADRARIILSETLDSTGRTIGEALLEPHRSYLPSLRPFLGRGIISGMAHITGGGIEGNLGRIVPADLEAVIDPSRWSVPAIFELIERRGEIARDEMFRVFNMGIGFVVIVRPESADALVTAIDGARVIGRVEPRHGDGPVRLSSEADGSD